MNADTAPLSELELIREFRKRLPSPEKPDLGIGDDCAIIRPTADAPEDWVITTDAVTHDIHFDQMATPEQIGHKAVARAISDIAAMGASPRWCWLNLVCPESTDTDVALAMMESASNTARSHGAMILGGDTSTGPSLSIHVFGMGTVPTGTSVLRSGAGDGDAIYVTGKLGGSIKGHHLTFTPRVAEGTWLRENGATAMIDLSDGLFTDIRHIMAESGCGATLHTRQIPVSEAAHQMHGDPIAHACQDGEDYELLVTAPSNMSEQIESDWQAQFNSPLFRIGTISTSHTSLQLQNDSGAIATVETHAYEHFN